MKNYSYINIFEKYFTLTVSFFLVLLPSVEVVARIFGGTAITASSVLVQHLTLWIGFAGAVIAARRNRLLSLTSTPLFSLEESIDWKNYIAKTVSIFVVLCLAYGAWDLIKIEKAYPFNIHPLFPRWGAMLIMPLGFLLIAIHMLQNSYDKWIPRFYVLITLLLLYFLFSFDLSY